MNLRFGAQDVAQPGTVVFLLSQSCVPGECGDNSTTFDIVIGDLTLERLDTQGTSLKYAGRFPNFQGSSSAPIQIVTQYQTFRLDAFLSFNLNTPPLISAVMPNMGQRGTNVLITGDDLIGPGRTVAISRVRLGESDAEIDLDRSNRMMIRVRATSGTPGVVDVRINTTDTFEGVMYDGPYLSLRGGWTQLEDGNITDIIPPAAQLGRIILLCGVNLLGGGTSITAIQHGSNTQLQLQTSPSPSTPPLPGSECLMAQIPLMVQGVNESVITITSDTGSTVVSISNFTISTIESVSPSRGQPGTVVTIQGQGLLSGYSDATPTVYLSEVLAMVLRSSNSEVVVRAGILPNVRPRINTTTNATIPPPQIFGVMGSVVIEVPNPLDPDNLIFNVSNATGWQYEEAGVLDSAFPGFGQYGTIINVNGSNLLAYGTSLTHATIGGVNATVLDGATNVLVQLVVPDSSTIGFVDVILFSDTGASVRGVGIFEYRERGVILSAMPDRGQRGTRGEF